MTTRPASASPAPPAKKAATAGAATTPKPTPETKSALASPTATIELKKFGDNQGSFRVEDVASARIELTMKDGSTRSANIAGLESFTGNFKYEATVAAKASRAWGGFKKAVKELL